MPDPVQRQPKAKSKKQKAIVLDPPNFWGLPHRTQRRYNLASSVIEILVSSPERVTLYRRTSGTEDEWETRNYLAEFTLEILQGLAFDEEALLKALP